MISFMFAEFIQCVVLVIIVVSLLETKNFILRHGEFLNVLNLQIDYITLNH